jgi:hypothetical protein
MSDKFPGGLVTAAAPAGYSVFFDGTGDTLSLPNNAAFAMSNGAFTIEFWFYTSSISQTGYILQTDVNSTALYISFSSSTLRLTDAATVYVSTPTLVANQWYHIAVVRSGTGTNQTVIYTNGVAGTAGTCAQTFTQSGPVIGGNGYLGYISNLRIVKGTALYTAAFTPPTQLFPVTNTSLLTCQSPTIIDNSTNNFAITVNGNTAVSTFTPFPSSYYFYNAPTDGNTRNMLPSNIAGFNPAYGAAAPGVWTLDQAQYFAANRLWPIYDPYFNQTTLMLPGNGTNGAQNNTFLDSSTNNFTITRNGNTTQGTYSPFSQTGWSNFLNGSSSIRVTSTSAVFDITGNFTVEGWYYITAVPVVGDLFGIEEDTSGWAAVQLQINTGRTLTLNISTAGGSWASTTTSTGTIALNTWNHVAVVRNGLGSNNITVYVNGVSFHTATVSTANLYSGGAFSIIGGRNAGGYITGYVSNFRYIKGTALYTSNFTPSTSPLTTTSQGATATEVEWLTCQDNRFVDNSDNAFTITPTGTPSIQPFSPFAPTIPYSATTVGGSGYFDGTGDWLSIASLSPSLSLGTSNFCIEAWGYWTSFDQGQYGAPLISFGGTGSQFMIRANKTSGSSTSANYYFVNNNVFIPSTGFSSGVSGGTIYLNTWTHIAVTRQGSTFRLFVNGALVNTQTDSGSYGTAYTTVNIGADSDTNNGRMLGYVAGARMVTGDAVYTAAFTPPTAPPTPISGTYLLTNFTNAAIIDATSDNVLETISTAQISTVQSRFGGSSLAFNGTSDVLRGVTGAINQFGTGDFTAEMWLYPTVFTSFKSIWCCSTSAANATGFHIGLNSSGQIFIYSASGFQVTSSNSMTLNAWNHVAIVRSGLLVRIYINGTVSTNSWTLTTQTFTDGAVVIGASPAANSEFYAGYIDDFRITRGFARYTANFVPPTSALQLQ